MLCSDTLLRHLKDHSEESPTNLSESRRLSSNTMDFTAAPQQSLSSSTVALKETTMLSEQPTSTDAALIGAYQGPSTSPQLNSGFDISLDAFNFDFEAQFPSWIGESDLQDGILDTPLVATMAELQPAWPESPYAMYGPASKFKPVSSMKRLWFMANDDGEEGVPPSGPATPPGLRDEVDDTYRQTILTQSLQIRPNKEQTALPSADFLNLCVRSYFARFHPIFPVVHAPTFRPSKANSMVLLSICSVGSLFTGSAHAIRQGVQIFERLHKAVLANWDRLIARGIDQRVSLIQTAIIGQTFGLLSGEPRHLAIVDAFNGTLISWARRSSTFRTKKMVGLDLDVPGSELETKWREWAKNEELIRIALSVHIHDAELAAMFHHEPFLRHNSRQLPVAASNQTFMAARAEDWRKAYLSESSNFESNDTTPASIDAHMDFDIVALPSDSYFTAYTILDGICANIVEDRLGGNLQSKLDETVHTLRSFHRHFLQESAAWEADHMDMTILWHLAFMTMFADFDLLERAIGRDGAEFSQEDQFTIASWANSDRARRCVIHGLVIQKRLENLPLGFEPAIHVPRAMFRAGIAWFCYTRFGAKQDGSHGTTSANDIPDYPEFKVVGVNPALLLFQASGYKYGKPNSTETNASLSTLTDLLRRIGHWEIARRFAAILAALLHNEGD